MIIIIIIVIVIIIIIEAVSQSWGGNSGMWIGIPDKEFKWGVGNSFFFRWAFHHVDLWTKGFSLEYFFLWWTNL